jgi:predicted nucleotidyltransferase component of viral defense system
MSSGNEHSIKERIKVIATQQKRPFNDVWQEVVLERWLSRLAKSKYRKNFIFKGAMCLLRYIDLERETRDLDFLLKDVNGSIEDVRKYLSEVSALDSNDGFSFDSLDVQPLAHTHMQYPGYSVSAIGHLGKTRTKIFIDIGVGDVVKATEITMKLLATEKAPLFEKDIALWAYPVESIFAEKLETALARGNQNSRMKDYHDLLCLIRTDAVDARLVKTAIRETFSNRGTELRPIVFPDSEIGNIQNYWTLYVRTLSNETKQEIPANISEVIEEINQYLKRSDIVS